MISIPDRGAVGGPLPVGAATRRPTRPAIVRWGSRAVQVGGDAPVVVQSMTNTDTADAIATALQVKELALAGSELVRITVNTPEAAREVPAIREQLDRMNIAVPLVGDFHYNGHKLLAQFPECAQALSKYRINPGNMGGGKKRDDNFAQMIEVACRYEKPVRIGVNWGSLDQDLLARIMDENAQRSEPWSAQAVMYEALITSAIENAQRAEQLGLGGALQGRHYYRLAHDLAGIARSRGAGVLIHQSGQHGLVQTAPVHAYAHRLIVAAGHLDHARELRVALLAAAYIAGVDAVFG